MPATKLTAAEMYATGTAPKKAGAVDYATALQSAKLGTEVLNCENMV